MTIALEQLADGSVSDRNFQRLMSLVLDTGGRSVGIRFGTGTATWTAAVSSAAVTIPHGLGRTPVAVFLSTRNPLVGYAASSIGATSFVATGFETANLAITTTNTFDWLVIG